MLKVMQWYWEHSEQKGSNLLALIALADWASDETGDCYPGMTSIAKKLRKTPRAAQSTIAALEEKGEVIVIPGEGITSRGGTTNRYYLVKYCEAMGISIPRAQCARGDKNRAHDRQNGQRGQAQGGEETFTPSDSKGVKFDVERGEVSRAKGVKETSPNTQDRTQEQPQERESASEPQHGGGGFSDTSEDATITDGEVFDAWQNNFSMLTPMLADALGDLCDEYTPGYVMRALDIAVRAEKRSLRYVEGILKKIRTEGLGVTREPEPHPLARMAAQPVPEYMQ